MNGKTVDILPPQRRAWRGMPDKALTGNWGELSRTLDEHSLTEPDDNASFLLLLAAYGAAQLAAERRADLACMFGRRG